MTNTKTAFLLLSFLLISACEQREAQHSFSEATFIKRSIPYMHHDVPTELILTKYETVQPNEWGERTTGVQTHFETSEKEIALTFDACGGPHGSNVDRELIRFLQEEQIPSTLFINSRWIEENSKIFQQLATNPLFQIENHGTHHQPLSVNGKSAWGISGTASVKEVIAEVKENQEKIENLTGSKSTLFRSGTAYYDEVAVQIAKDLGIQIVNYTILGDAGATFTSGQVKNALMTAKPGDIALLHMNQPKSGTSEGMKQAVPILKEKGFTFVQLHNQNLQ
ncbi:polysaccharide deacetylase family protein [Guptibacillus hwajinpoensis]|uniref:polysaccharide deacetylase family protein n=1 Tax=Guptibacillus hwajinpoensis TaxID=208199 RepID=UPI001F557512|nr:polysaccharide deacetylase family protein [Pseudalkalibacillus hwajinpoensis]